MRIIFGTLMMSNRVTTESSELMKKLKVEKNRKEKPSSLFEFSLWDVKTIHNFQNCLASLRSTPSSKALIASMIEFSQMYQDVKKNIFSTNYWTDFDGLNEHRRAQRAKIQMHKKDLLETVDGVNGKTLILTTRAHKIFYEQYPLAKLRKQKWNGTWTVVMYDLPLNLKTERDYLRRKLKRLGFGCVQKSILVSPLPLEDAVQELIEGERLEAYTVVLTAHRVLGLSDRQIATAAWNLKLISDLYNKLLEILPRVKRSAKKTLLEEWRAYFLAVNFADPYLPVELLPADWPGEKCKKEFAKLGLGGLLKSIFGL